VELCKAGDTYPHILFVCELYIIQCCVYLLWGDEVCSVRRGVGEKGFMVSGVGKRRMCVCVCVFGVVTVRIGFAIGVRVGRVFFLCLEYECVWPCPCSYRCFARVV
jgi:hypothetical protein